MHCNWIIHFYLLLLQLSLLFCFLLTYFNNTTYLDKSTQKSGRKRGEIGNAVLLNCACFFSA